MRRLLAFTYSNTPRWTTIGAGPVLVTMWKWRQDWHGIRYGDGTFGSLYLFVGPIMLEWFP